MKDAFFLPLQLSNFILFESTFTCSTLLVTPRQTQRPSPSQVDFWDGWRRRLARRELQGGGQQSVPTPSPTGRTPEHPWVTMQTEVTAMETPREQGPGGTAWVIYWGYIRCSPLQRPCTLRACWGLTGVGSDAGSHLALL